MITLLPQNDRISITFYVLTKSGADRKNYTILVYLSVAVAWDWGGCSITLSTSPKYSPVLYTPPCLPLWISSLEKYQFVPSAATRMVGFRGMYRLKEERPWILIIASSTVMSWFGFNFSANFLEIWSISCLNLPRWLWPSLPQASLSTKCK